jgi:cytochrome P450
MSTIAPTSSSAPVLAAPVPPAAPLSLFAYLRTIRQSFIATLHEDIYRQPIIERKFLGAHSFILNDPAGIRHVLLDNVANYPKAPIEHRLLGPALGNGLILSEGETWRAHRRIMAPAFDHRTNLRCASIMTDAALKLTRHWDSLRSGTIVEVSSAMLELTLEIISRSMFSADSDTITEVVREGSDRYQHAMMFSLLDFLPGIGHLVGLRKARRGREMMQEFDRAFSQVYQARTQGASKASFNDLLERLISARDEETGIAMTEKEIRDQVITIFIAGHETTAIALMWTCYLLSQHPDQEARMHQELKSVLNGRTPSSEDVARLPFTRMVLQESMRLYPPAYSFAFRRAIQNDEICGKLVPKGSDIIILPWVLHRHRSHWDHPDRFDPDRFSPEAIAARDRLVYLPFGFGPRICIGASFAMTEAILVLATIAQRYRLRLAPGFHVEPQAQFTLRAKYGMCMELERRRN